LMEKAPYLNNKELYDIVVKSSHLYPYGNNYIGYGVPQADRALVLIKDQDVVFNTTRQVEVKSNKYKQAKLSKEFQEAVLFNKKNETIVINQELIPVKKGKLILKRKEGV